MNKRNNTSDGNFSGKRGSSKKDSFRSNPDRRDSDRGPRSRDKDGDSTRPSKRELDERGTPKREGSNRGNSDKPYSGPRRSEKRDGDAGFDGRKKSFSGPKRFEKGGEKRNSDKTYSDRKKSVDGPRRRDKDGGEGSYGDRKKSFGSPRGFEKKDGDSRYGDRKKSFDGPKRSERSEGDSRYGDRKKSFDGPKRSERSEGDSRYGDRKKSFDGPKRSERNEGDSRYGDRKKSFDGPKKFEKRDDSRGDKPNGDRKKSFGDSRDDSKRSFNRSDDRAGYSGPKRKPSDDDAPKREFKGDREGGRGDTRSFDRNKSWDKDDKRKSFSRDRKSPEEKKRPRTSKFNEKDQELIGNWRNDRPAGAENRDDRKKKEVLTITEETRLNKFLANSGLCSRRDADDYIANGAVTINGQVVKELGIKVMPGDEVRFKGRHILPEKPVYILMNKPKDCITSSDDPEGRRTVLDIIGESVEERIFPVGRLDRNTTGVLLLTNDGDLAQKLTHPSFGVHKIYKADLDKPMTAEDMAKLTAGVDLEDGFIQPDEVAFVDESRQVVGLEIHSGKNHIVHRMFNSLGYLVEKLDRVSFSGLSKDGLKRGEIRHLTEKELLTLRKSTGKKKA